MVSQARDSESRQPTKQDTPVAIQVSGDVRCRVVRYRPLRVRVVAIHLWQTIRILPSCQGRHFHRAQRRTHLQVPAKDTPRRRDRRRLDLLTIPRHTRHVLRGDHSEHDALVQVAPQRKLSASDARVAHEVRPADEYGLVRAELEVVAERAARARRDDWGPVRRSCDRVRVQHELRGGLEDGHRALDALQQRHDGVGPRVAGEGCRRRIRARARAGEREGDLACRIGVAVEEKDIPAANGPRVENTSGRVKHGRVGAIRVVCHEDLALATIQRD